MKPYFITFSGIDDSVSDRCLREYIAVLKDLDQLDKVEFGVLFMLEKLGQDRYPTVEWIQRFVEEMKKHDVRLSLHLCGAAIFKSLLNYKTATDFFLEMDWFDRFQLNVNARQEDLAESQLHELYGAFWDSHKTYVLQCHDNNRANIHNHLYSLAKVDPQALKRVHILYDSSKGKGLTPNEWPKFFDDRLVDHCNYDNDVMRGYAGGMGPDNVRSEIDRINLSRCTGPNTNTMAPYEYWIDMETNIRSKTPYSTRFDFDKVIETVTKVYG